MANSFGAIGPLHDPVTWYKIILVSKLHSGTSKTKAGQGGLVRVALFWKSHCATCSPVYLLLYHVTGSCKGPIMKEAVFESGLLQNLMA